MLNLKKFMRKKRKKINKAKEELKFQIEWKQIIFEINQFAKECSEKQARRQELLHNQLRERKYKNRRRQNQIAKTQMGDNKTA